MNLNNLKPAWQRFKLLNSLQSVNHEEILLIIENAERTTVSKAKIAIHALVFLLLTLSCQGG